MGDGLNRDGILRKREKEADTPDPEWLPQKIIQCGKAIGDRCNGR